ncbi:MAG: TAXI family TRAP transporter solute-binding subunit [Deltaproteobacteria bacterium]|nr:TAXI family TRAP transporter solute-binding subunit [Deltaproteobacteria bacterium]
MSRVQRFLAVSLVAVFVATLAPAALAESYKFGASKPGGSWYPIGTVLQRLAEKNHGDKVTVEIGGGTSNLLNVMSGKLDFGLVSATSIQEALKGAKMFKGKEAQAKKVRVAAVLYPNYLFWLVWAKSDITSYKQLKGKRVNVMPKRFSFQALNQQMLGALGISYDDFAKVNYLGFNDAVAQMKDNHIDAYLGPGEENYAPIVQLAAHAPIRILSFSKEDVAKMNGANAAAVPFTLDKKYYDQKSDVSTVQTFVLIVSNEDVPAERVYKVTKAIYENLGDFAGAVKAMGRVKLANATVNVGAPRHAGMDKYLKEKGTN